MRAAAPTSAVEPSPKAKAMIDELMEGLRETADSVVPWFLSQMPRMYFQDTNHLTQLAHLRSIIAMKASGRPLEVTLRNEDGSEWTCVRPANRPGVLAELVAGLPMDPPLRAAKIHTAGDGSLVLDTFEFGEPSPFDPTDRQQAHKVEETVEYARRQRIGLSEAQIRSFFDRCSAEYVSTVTPLRICKHYDLVDRVSGTEGLAIVLEPESDTAQSRITIAAANSTTRVMLERCAARLARSSINIHRAYLDLLKDGPNGTICIVGFVVQTTEGRAIDADSELWRTVQRDMVRIKWYDYRTLELAARHNLDLERADALHGLCQLVHQVLVKVNPYAFSRERILTGVERALPQALAVVDLFVRRFDPDGPTGDAAFGTACAAVAGEIDLKVGTEDVRTVLHKMIEAVRATYRTNFFLPHRCALSLRLDPRFLVNDERPETAFGTFFVHGRGFNGFHVRFQEIARGGLRVVRPTSLELHAREAERLYDEVYGLAFAQQLKNKDIPEGGAKAAILLEPDIDTSRSVKAFVDSVLDLITPEPKVRERIVDRFGRQELIYLGPDENITPTHIEWIVDRAGRRGYPMPNAFMSSKPGAGINHKVYGVTSEGVNVFLGVALKAIGIDPAQQPFTVKITGGPDGDVAGNMMKILDRDYGGNARIVGIADGSGCGEDPDGLDHAELLRLVEASLPIASFDRSKLGPRGRVVAVSYPDGVLLRNTMHNRIVADAFVTGGGRPGAIHNKNWRDYLLPDGTPTSKVIVEGANLFLTPEARLRLSELGVLIVKDSSANKCGVICSSYEIAACMLLSTEQFLAIKPVYVQQVLEKLRELARREALLLMAERKRHPDVPLPEMSIRLSKVINRAAEAIAKALPTWSADDRLLARTLVLDHLPKILVDTVGDRLWESLPEAYRFWTKAQCLAARIVYREGVEYLEPLPVEAISPLGAEYLRRDIQLRQLLEEIRTSDLPHRDRIAALLARSGARAALSE
ncbi:MAG: NAD-glutamate dehydrogenase [Phycisphaerales bacterium]|nr:NAD-glutamate dehydrogenase [Phycisphaerales bacterium]